MKILISKFKGERLFLSNTIFSENTTNVIIHPLSSTIMKEVTLPNANRGRSECKRGSPGNNPNCQSWLSPSFSLRLPLLHGRWNKRDGASLILIYRSAFIAP